ncbi:MAG TPA: hypothetical protein VGL62_10540, partial [Vicinamibacterales bacterium]
MARIVRGVSFRSASAAAASLLVVTACGRPARSFVTVDSHALAFTHVRVIDGTGAPAKDDQTVVVRDGKIESVGNTAVLGAPSDARAIDGRGKTLIPGL